MRCYRWLCNSSETSNTETICQVWSDDIFSENTQLFDLYGFLKVGTAPAISLAQQE
jgi:hypothetical protein